MNILSKWKKLINGNGEEQETDFLPAILEVTETPPSPVGRTVLWTLMLFLFVGLLWACFGSVDEVAVATGKVIPKGEVKMIQSKNKGVIKKIYVKEGDYVKAGDVLVELDPTSTGADLDNVKKRAAYYKLDIERLEAELTGNPFVPEQSGELEQKDVLAQQSLYQSRMAQYKAERSAAEMEVQQKQSSLGAEQSTYDKYNGMLQISEEKVSRLESLSDVNAISRFQLLDQKSQEIELSKSVEGQVSQVAKANAEVAAAEQKLQNVEASYKKEVMTNLVEARKQYYSLQEEIKKADENSRLATIVAPVDGRVGQLAVHTVGGIVTDAQALMSLVPDNVEMELEVWADNKDIGFIKEGQKAEVKVQTFNFQKFGVVEATVAEISPDVRDDSKDKNKDNKYRLILTMNNQNMDIEGQKTALMPGMEVTSEIKIKTKRILDFFIDPFRKYTGEALRER